MNERTKKLAKQARLFHELLGPSVETRYMKKKEVLKLWSIVEFGLGGYPLQSGLRPTDAELERRTGEPHIDGYPLQSLLPPPAKEKS